jgi:hypothetical protein
MLAAAFAVHQLRIVAGYGAGSHEVLGAPGHEYLPLLAGVVAVLVAVAALRWGWTLVGAARGRDLGPRGRRASFARNWAGTSVSLIGMYLAQAGLEALIDPTHPIWGHGGWTVVPIALVVGALVVLALRGADAAVERAASWSGAQAVQRRARARVHWAPAALPAPRPPALASHLSGRAPPLPA